jgi:hypothetical protein
LPWRKIDFLFLSFAGLIAETCCALIHQQTSIATRIPSRWFTAPMNVNWLQRQRDDSTELWWNFEGNIVASVDLRRIWDPRRCSMDWFPRPIKNSRGTCDRYRNAALNYD